MSYAVHVSNIAPTTTEAHLHDFFTFCGKIKQIAVDETATPKAATIHFEKPAAANTALMLNGGTLDGVPLTVVSETEHPEEPSHEYTADSEINQADKPRAGIAAEYLAKGYVLSDHILQRAIDLDTKNGISSKFLTWWHSFDHTAGSKISKDGVPLSSVVQGHVNTATEKAKSIDQQQGISARGNEYYTKALSSPYGQHVRNFYTTTSKQLLDIHEEAKRIAGQNTPAHPTTAAPTTGTVPTGAAPAVTTAATATPATHVETAPTVV